MALVGAFAAGSGTASYGKTPTCTPPSATSQPFLGWNDHASYFLAPGGAFESSQDLNGWSISGYAKRVGGNEGWYVHSRYDNDSLSIGQGSSVTSPSICVTVHTPVMRFFMRNNGSSSSSMKVKLNYTDKYGNAKTTTLGTYSAGSRWSLSPQIAFLNNIAPIVGGQDQTSVSFTFTPTGWDNDTWQIDDFYVDPLKSQ